MLQQFAATDPDHEGRRFNLNICRTLERVIQLDARAGHHELVIMTCGELLDIATRYAPEAMRRILEEQK